MDDGLHPATVPLRPATIRRSAAVAARFTAGGVAALAVGVWLVVDSRGTLLSWLWLAVAAGITGWFAIQLVMPSLFTMDLDEGGLHTRTPRASRDIPWDQVDVIRVGKTGGDDVLKITARAGSELASVIGSRQLRLPLPLGGDVNEVHRFLSQRLGRLTMSGDKSGL